MRGARDFMVCFYYLVVNSLGSLALKLGKSHHIVKLFSAQATHLAEQYACIQPLVEAETAPLRKKISGLESKIAKLELENAKLKGLDVSKLESSKRKSRRKDDGESKHSKSPTSSSGSGRSKKSSKHKDKSDKGEKDKGEEK